MRYTVYMNPFGINSYCLEALVSLLQQALEPLYSQCITLLRLNQMKRVVTCFGKCL